MNPALADRFITTAPPKRVKVKIAQLCPALCDPVDCPWSSPDQNTGVGSFSLLQGILPTQGSNPGFPHCRQILYQLSHKGGPIILEWVAYPFSSRPSHPGIQPGSPGLQSDSLPIELSRKPICLQRGRPGFNPWVHKSPWRRESQPTPVFLTEKSHG